MPLPFRIRVVAAVLVSLLFPLLAPASAAQDASAELRNGTSLGFVPDDVGFYVSISRTREIYDAIAGSRAIAKLMEQPFIKEAGEGFWQGFERGAGASEADDFFQWVQLPESEPLRALLLDCVSQEIFMYGDTRWADLIDVYQRMNNLQYFTIASIMLRGGFDEPPANLEQEIIAAYVDLVVRKADVLKPPVMVIGFKVTDAERARGQIARLEAEIRKLPDDDDAAQRAKKLLKRESIGGGTFLTMTITEEMIREEAKDELDHVPDQFRPAIETILKGFRLTVALGVWRDYVLLSVGPTNDHLAALGTGKLLLDRPEMAPLRRAGQKRIYTVGYGSAEFARRMHPEATAEDLVEFLGREVEAATIDDALRQKLRGYVAELRADLKRVQAQPIATSGYGFLTDSGTESFTYQWGQKAGTQQPLSILDHLGGKPLLFAAGRSAATMEDWHTAFKWLHRTVELSEDLALPKLQPEQRQAYDLFREKAAPLAVRLEKALLEQVLPALDGQFAFAIGGELKMGEFPAIPSVAFVWGVQDATRLRAGVSEYQEVAQGAIDAIREVAPDTIPEIPLPQPEEMKTDAGTVWAYEPIGEVEPFRIATGLSAKTAVLALGADNAKALLRPTPLALETPLPSADRALTSALYVDMAGCVDAVQGWVDFAVLAAGGGGDAEATQKQIKALLDLARCLRSLSSVTYADGEATVTHGRMIVRDLAE
jgi:hypothetical protein